MSLRLRLLIALAPLFVFGLVVADVGTYAALNNFLVSQVDGQLRDAHETVLDALQQQQPSRGGPGGFIPVPPGTYGAVLDSNGHVVAGPLDLQPAGGQGHPVLPATLPGGDAYITVAGTGSTGDYRVYLDRSEIRIAPDTLVVALPLSGAESTLHQLLLLELLVSGGVTLVIVVATVLIVRRGLRPLERMATTARSIVASDLSRRVEPSTERTEVGRLGLALNTMLAQLEGAFAERKRNEQRLRHFISDASHELRTPLTSMQGYAELLQRAPDMERGDLLLAMRRMEEETKRMGLLVDDLLLLARLDQGRPLERVPVDLEALVRDACADASVTDPQRSVTARVAAPLQVTGDAMRLRQVLSNLVRNALVHTPRATPVEVALYASDGMAVVDVIDHGGGIPPGHDARIFERFHRADPERSGDRGGSGLGLSIVAAVVAAHQGSVHVLDTPGGGATFRVALPLETAGRVRPHDASQHALSNLQDSRNAGERSAP